jgi:uncharacterized surface protein with fasciclin (FAS1) repeats
VLFSRLGGYCILLIFCGKPASNERILHVFVYKSIRVVVYAVPVQVGTVSNMTNTRKLTTALLTAGALTLAACGSNSEDVVETTTAPETTSVATEDTTPADDQALGDIVDIASAAGSFNTLVAAVEAAGLVETLKTGGPFTVFAPSDEAFAALPAGVVEKLLLPENVEVLKAILTYHVVSGEVTSDKVAAGAVPSVQGENIDITVGTNGSVQVNGANVVAVDIAAANGVIHVIDAVILPPSIDLSSL